MNVYWCKCGSDYGNFGDKLTPLLLRHFGVSCTWSSPDQADLIGIGSILDVVTEDFRGLIWSSGFMHQESHKRFEQARILALRGHLTSDRIESSRGGMVLGDAGLLCDVLYSPRPKRYKLGIIPHYIDMGSPVVAAVAGSMREARVIDICAETLDVIDAVGECEYIVSSSLHGLILADSLSIPNHWIALDHGQWEIEGRGFKFNDYYSVFGITDARPEVLRPDDDLESILSHGGHYSRPGIAEIKNELLRSLYEIVETHPRVSPERLRNEADADRLEYAQRRQWSDRLDRTRNLLVGQFPPESSIVLADDDQLDRNFPVHRVYSIMELDGQPWGAPLSDDDAIRGLEKLREQGANYFVIVWPAFWWLDYYTEFHQYLRARYAMAIENDQIIAFDLGRMPGRLVDTTAGIPDKSRTESTFDSPVRADPDRSNVRQQQ